MKYNLYILYIFLFLIPTINLFSQDGEITTFYSDGNGRSREYFAHGVHEGKSYWYYRNGNLQSIKNYTGGKLDGWLRNFYETGIIKEEIHIKEGVLDGISSFYYDNGGLKETRIYSYGKLVKQNFVSYDSNYVAPPLNYMSVMNKKNIPKGEKDFLCDADICPEPIGGLKAIQDKLIYPDHAKLYGLEGDVIVNATIDTKGNVISANVIKGIGLGCDEAALQAVRKTRFIPARNNGKTVQSDVSFKVKFRLENKSELISSSSKVKNSDVKLSDFVAVKKKEKSVKSVEKNVEHKKRKSSKFIVCNLENCPEPKEGFIAIIKKIKYPQTAKRLGIEGNIILEAKIDEFGIVLEVQVLKGIGYGCDQEAKTAVYRTDFFPAEVDGKPVKSKIQITIPFRIGAMN